MLNFGGTNAVSPSGTVTDVMHGITNYANGVIAAQADDLYFSLSGTSYVNINKKYIYIRTRNSFY